MNPLSPCHLEEQIDEAISRFGMGGQMEFPCWRMPGVWQTAASLAAVTVDGEGQPDEVRLGTLEIGVFCWESVERKTVKKPQ